MSAVFFAAGLTIAAIGPSLPALAAHSGADVAALGGLFTAFSGGVIIAQFAIVRASGRFGQRASLAASMLLMGAGALTIATAGALWLLLAAALLAGAGFGGVLAVGNTLVAQLFPERRAAALNAINLFFGVGSIVGPALAGVAGARLGTPQAALWAGAALVAALSLSVLRVATARTQAHASRPGGLGGGQPARPWLLSLLLSVYVGSEVGLGAWLTLYMITSVALAAPQAALVVSMFWLALTSGRTLAAMLGGRLSAQGLLMLCLAGLLLGAGLLAAGVGNLALTLAGVALFGLSCGPVFPTVIAMVSAGPQGDALTSRALALGNSGGLLLPALIGLLLTRSGPASVGIYLLGAAGLMIVLAWLAVRPQPGAHVAADADCPAAT
jgi:fucose permease